MQDQSSSPAADPGFRVPAASAPAASAPPAATSGAQPMEVAPSTVPVTDTSTRDIAIGSAIFVCLLAVYFFVRGSYVHHLVVKRVAPASAANAGWLLFAGLAFVSAAIVLAVVNASKFLNWAVTGPLVLVGAVALIAALFVGRR